jgi:hypothetical protein
MPEENWTYRYFLQVLYSISTVLAQVKIENRIDRIENRVWD